MKEYKFFGWESADVPALNEEYSMIKDPRHLYDLLSEVWCADTCAPRMRDAWSKDNMTLGQCSITSFLAQDIFGGKVYGILRPDGNYHCYNVVGDCVFDLTSEQFLRRSEPKSDTAPKPDDCCDEDKNDPSGDEVLSYDNNPEQFREVHFSREEKRLRYELLRERLRKLVLIES